MKKRRRELLHADDNISGPAVAISRLPDDLLVEILARLPIKSACQCKSVSKHWLSLISSPFFRSSVFAIKGGDTSPFIVIAECHFRAMEHKAELRIPCSSSANNIMFGSRGFSLNFLPYYHQDFRVCGSSNGLLLCCDKNRIRVKYDVYYVCNPFKKVWFQLPPAPPIQEIDGYYYGQGCFLIGFTCDPHYNNNNDRYRVVRTQPVSTIPGMSLPVDIFSSETGKWSRLILSCPSSLLLTSLCYYAVVCNGILHWITESHGLFAFDPFKETSCNGVDQISFIDLPPELSGKNIYMKNAHFGMCRERLRIFYTFVPSDGGEYGPVLRVWELVDYTAGKWCLLHDIRMSMNISCSDTSSSILISDEWNADEWKLNEWKSIDMSVAFHPYDGDIVYIWFPSNFFSCNLRHKRFEVIHKIKTFNYRAKCRKLLLAQPWCHTTVECPPFYPPPHAKRTPEQGSQLGEQVNSKRKTKPPAYLEDFYLY